MRRGYLRRAVPGLCVVALLACERDGTGPIGGTSSLRIVWPQAVRTLADSATVAAAIFTTREGDPSNITFTATLDGGAAIPGVRQDSVVIFPISVLTDGSHTLTVRASNGAVAAPVTFSRAFVGRPRITSVTPDSARAGFSDRITIRGARLSGINVRVYLNGAQLQIAGTPTSDSIAVTVTSGQTLRSGLLSVEVDRRLSPDLRPLRIVGAPPTTAPQVFLLIPNDGPRFMPVAIAGSGFGSGATPFVSGVSSVPLFNVSTQSLPLIGSVSVGFTIVPTGVQSGLGSISVSAESGSSNAFPFTVN